MRILESCTTAWPMPELQTQIDALREAFSADTSRPFELKSSFPYGSPTTNIQSSPSLELKYQPQVLSGQGSHEQTAHVNYHPHPLTPPISGDQEDRDGQLIADSLEIMANSQLSSASMDTHQAAWNPTRIFEYGSEKQKHKVKLNTDKSNSQWTTAFETPSSIIDPSNNFSQTSSPLYTPATVAPHDLPPLHDALMQQQQYSASSSMAPLSRMQSAPPQPSYTSAGPSFVTPSMWRDTVASTYDPGGLKRRWDMESSFLIDPVQPKRSR